MKTVPILIIGNFLSQTTRTRSVCEDLAKQLRQSRSPVVTASSKKSRTGRLLDMLSTIWQKRNEYSIAQVDLFSGPAFLWAEASCWMLRKLGKPYILTLHGGNLAAFSRRNPNRVRTLLNSAAAVTSPSAYLLESMMKFRNDLILLPNPIDLNTLPFTLRRDLRPKLIWLRAFHKIYNPGLAAEALAQLTNHFPNIELIMGGPDKDGTLKQFKETAERLNVSERIHLSGPIERREIANFLNQGDIFLNTTFVDNTPVSVIEAMACGICVVSTNVGGIPMLIRDEQDALLVPPDDPKSMAQAIHRLLTNSELASKISLNARAKVEDFDWSRILPRWESLFLKFCRNNSNAFRSKNTSVTFHQ